jgi:hypothetical protein
MARGVTLVRIAALPLALISLAAVSVVGDGTAGCSGNKCVDFPAPSQGDLSCDTDEDCTLVPSGTECACDCNCGGVAANQAFLTKLTTPPPFANTSCSRGSGCGCPAQYLSRCIAGQCTLCGNPTFGPIAGQPAACNDDAGTSDASNDAEDSGGDAAADAGPSPEVADHACGSAAPCMESCPFGTHDVTATIDSCPIWLCCVPEDAGAE